RGGLSPLDRGGGLFAVAASPTLRHVRFRRNTAWGVPGLGGEGHGGGAYVEGGTPRFEGVLFEGNRAVGGGALFSTGAAGAYVGCVVRDNAKYGAVRLEGGDASTFEGCLFEGNVGYSDAGPSTGTNSAVFVADSSPRFVGCVFRGNGGTEATTEGGGAFIEGAAAAPVFEGCLFEGNAALGAGGAVFVQALAAPLFLGTTFRANRTLGGGAAVQSNDAFPTFVACTFEHNEAIGGAFGSDTSAPVLLNAVFRGNRAHAGGFSDGAGGALSAYLNGPPPGVPLVANAVFVGNEAPAGFGGAVVVGAGAPLRMVNVTAAGNRAGQTGGALHLQDGAGVRLENVVVWGNEAEEGAGVFVAAGGAGPTVERAVLQGGCPEGAPCAGVLGADPLFVRSPDPGPDGEWGTGDDDYGDLRLQEGSPAVDHGLEGLLPADVWDLDGDGDTQEPLPVDLAGGPRVQGGAPDLGAYEGAVAVAAEPVDPVAGVGASLAVWPNPAGEAVTAGLTLSRPVEAEVVVLDVLGRRVAVLHRGPLAAGGHRLGLDGRALVPGLYVVRAAVGAEVLTRRLTVVR
ncbi:MAG: choice-of-anchor Q domain-containing protein, partial [Rhodothermales bacterium]|nr:choice-of-anchor Q domain-containing protein [Rhodothermales bacterium]